MALKRAQEKLAIKLFQHIFNPNEYLVTAHHLNDQTETFFLALKRGAGCKV